ncbi:transient receptor potential cation channel subfamily M member 3-like [Antedon mediterranea]|uniref:transient receptor potential cation channel subfamily M member 3-like n=1 Tax=Antedon mediterranea TaxID=105859 RepID=UPI003AF4F50F
MAQSPWIETSFFKKECKLFSPSGRDSYRCGCGRSQALHRMSKQHKTKEPWSPKANTIQLPTDAYGRIEFQGGGHGNKAQFLRLSDETPNEMIYKLLSKTYKLDIPNLVISIRGGFRNFDLQPKLKLVLCRGLKKAAKTTGAWVITTGINSGVTLHCGDALDNHSVKLRGRVVTIGIAPWGVLNKKESLIGKGVSTPYHTVSCPPSKGVKLNSHHTHFLLVDNGTIGQFGTEIALRCQFEQYMSKQKLPSGRMLPVIAVVIEGGVNTIHTIRKHVTSNPPIPVVVFDGTGRAADLLAFAYKYTSEGSIDSTIANQLIDTLVHTFHLVTEEAHSLLKEIIECVKNKELVTVFCLSEGEEELDLAILTALLKAQQHAFTDQLSLAMAWDRVDIAKTQVFVYGREWPESALEQAMQDALMADRVEFVRLLKDNGVNMHKFLTVRRLEDLYNLKQRQSSSLRYLLKEIRKIDIGVNRCTLHDIGVVVEKLMGGSYRSAYTKKKFRNLYHPNMKKGFSFGNDLDKEGESSVKYSETFNYPFNELLAWAVLMKRHKMAIFMWQQDEEGMAKALVASKLYKGMARIANDVHLDTEIGEELRKYSTEFQNLAFDLLDQCYRQDDDFTMQLLTVQLKNWSNQTCLSIAAIGNHREFTAHICCQLLLNDLWLGGLQLRKYMNFKVLCAIFIPPTLLALTFKTKEELQLQPQTLEEFIQEQKDETTSATSRNNVNEEEDEQDFNHIPLRSQRNELSSSRFKPLVACTSHNLSQHRSLRLGKKVYEFYNAPITKFWTQTLTFILFMGLYSYIVLIPTPVKPSLYEWIVVLYIVTFAAEQIREFVTSEPSKVLQKVEVWYEDYWNIHDSVAILLFLLGFGFRMNKPTLQVGRVIYSADVVFWYLKFLDILSINIYLGPFVTMMGKMMRDMAYFIVLLLLIMLSFGVVRQSITHQNMEPSWAMLRNIFHEPYWMIYGEVYASDINPCGDEPDPSKCVPGHWVVPSAMALYCIVANILLINLLIATFNNTYARIRNISDVVWKFQRYRLIMEYEQKSILVPPFVILQHVFLFLRTLLHCCCRDTRPSRDKGLKLFLPDEDIQLLNDFEEECMELYFRSKEARIKSSNEQRLNATYERVENVELKLDEIIAKENLIKVYLNSLDTRLNLLESVCFQTVHSVRYLQHLLTAMSMSESRDSISETEKRSNDDSPTKPTVQRRMTLSDTILTPPSTASSKEALAYLWEPSGGFLPLKGTMDSKQDSLGSSSTRKTSVDKDKLELPISEVNEFEGERALKSLAEATPVSSVRDDISPMSSIWTKAKKKVKSSQQRLSTFEKYATMIAPTISMAISPDTEAGPIKRQMGFEEPIQLKVPSKLGALSRIESESNLSMYSESGLTKTSIRQPTPYRAAPAYSTITDHIDTREVDIQERLDQSRALAFEYWTMTDGATNNQVHSSLSPAINHTNMYNVNLPERSPTPLNIPTPSSETNSDFDPIKVDAKEDDTDDGITFLATSQNDEQCDEAETRC